ncbi:MAG: hypothetical protein A2315_15575 [Ignavibacteria bacterium RIFOXYB2_FULL_35_12]|nr:MAG: hypothetical protein A2058_08650 [Ignavibacteria bacterium GWA2_36_19]OGU55594.1 MAG: hypothetical protein A2006_10500 [Ignavibacteria bacterium GWC2_35_8]OGU56131.1 MAG: hypothetical protein A2X60_12145 [Ignavibacteria bacterium GWF2_35_20]OGU78223.1 MAG: hypothetical protein A2254_10795 [Ignavibacteria bacterium RIFOXYA2_FULL_35_9]OGU91411.1 MAG: hypothetical protein A3K31_14980 [Ignavibacteria bacterium RIFOXYA12_FULL_35_25]OGU92003.1 MAG: hypothetical protein A2492_01040 [Ignavibac
MSGRFLDFALDAVKEFFEAIRVISIFFFSKTLEISKAILALPAKPSPKLNWNTLIRSTEDELNYAFEIIYFVDLIVELIKINSFNQFLRSYAQRNSFMQKIYRL